MNKATQNDADSLAAVASYIAQAEKRLSEQVRKQFAFMVVATLLPTLVIILVLVVIPLFARQPSNTQLLILIEESNAEMAEITKAILNSTTPITPTTTRALEAILQQADLHRQAIEEIRQSQAQTTPETQSLIQIIGSAAILTLLGALGIQRLQNIDTEINNVRESVFAQAESRAQSIRETLSAQIGDQVQRQFTKARQEVQSLIAQSRQTLEQISTDAQHAQEQIRAEIQNLETSLSEVRELIDKYPWLRTESRYRAASQIQRLLSVEQAQSLAEQFRRQDDEFSAREALRAIITQDLAGDYADFHNAYSEAMRLKDPRLALEIVERGLSFFPEDPDLVADRVRALYSLGCAKEAKEFIENWRQAKPEQFSRSWRPVVFYEDLFDSLELTQDDFAKLNTAFQDVSSKLPHEIKVWAEYADLMTKQGQWNVAEDIFKKGLEFNPHSQQLNFMLGDLLLKQGRNEEAVKYLEKSLAMDYQDQYQHDVDQFAVRVRLAQAYEAIGKLDKAQLLYRSVISGSGVIPTIRDYALNRLAAIALRQDKLPEERAINFTPTEMLEFIKRFHLDEGEEAG